MTTFNDTPENIAYLAALFGFEPVTAKAWIRLEGQATANPTNPLNIRNSLEMIGQTPQGFAYFETPFHGLRSARLVIERNAPAYGYDRILNQAWSQNPLQQAKVIERSSWAAGNYGSDWANDKPGGIWKYVKGQSVQEIVLSGSPQFDQLGTIGANIEILDGVGKVVTKTTGAVEDVPVLGLTEDGLTAILWANNTVRFVRAAPSGIITTDPCSDEVKAAIDDLNKRIDDAQGQ